MLLASAADAGGRTETAVCVVADGVNADRDAAASAIRYHRRANAEGRADAPTAANGTRRCWRYPA